MIAQLAQLQFHRNFVGYPDRTKMEFIDELSDELIHYEILRRA